MKRKPTHILAARFSAMGDVAMTIPVLYPLALANPEVRFTLFTKKGFEKMFVERPANLEVAGIAFSGNAWSDAMELRRHLAQVQPDIYVDLHDVLRSRLLGMLCRLRGIAVVRFDKARKGKKRLVKASALQASPVTPTTERYAAAFRQLGLDAPLPFTGIFAHEPALPEGMKLDPASINIGIAPFARHDAKAYPAAMMRQVLEAMTVHPGCHIMLFGGGAKEEEMLRELARGLPGVEVVADSAPGLDGELRLMRHLDAMLTMDSANMHLAALAGVPLLSLWGPTHPAAGFAPYPSAPQQMLQMAGMACRPCSVFGNKDCPLKGADNHRCMTAIAPATVAQSLMALAAKHHTQTTHTT